MFRSCYIHFRGHQFDAVRFCHNLLMMRSSEWCTHVYVTFYLSMCTHDRIATELDIPQSIIGSKFNANDDTIRFVSGVGSCSIILGVIMVLTSMTGFSFISNTCCADCTMFDHDNVQ